MFKLMVVGSALLILTVTASGCAVRVWRPDMNEADYKRDSWECERDASMASVAYRGYGIDGFYRKCMEARGYLTTPPPGVGGFAWYFLP